MGEKWEVHGDDGIGDCCEEMSFLVLVLSRLQDLVKAHIWAYARLSMQLFLLFVGT